MKPIKVLLLIFCCLATANTFAQSPKAIEADLLKSFKRISYWDDNKRNNDNGDDSLQKANEVFAKKLKTYTEKYTFTLSEPLTSLKKERLDIFTSTDGLLRIYSWETWMGGTMRDFSNLMQYKSTNSTKAILLTSDPDNYIPFYNNLYTFKTVSKTYYLGIYNNIYSTKDAGTGIRVFSIENGKLNSDTKIIKTQSGLKSKIYYTYDFFSVVNIAFELRPTITFEAASNTIKIPLVDTKGKITSKFIIYKFNGHYFEKVKS
ncbi:MAG: hypothetical protein V4520_20720 [Bacteroidota bacterium]